MGLSVTAIVGIMIIFYKDGHFKDKAVTMERLDGELNPSIYYDDQTYILNSSYINADGLSVDKGKMGRLFSMKVKIEGVVIKSKVHVGLYIGMDVDGVEKRFQRLHYWKYDFNDSPCNCIGYKETYDMNLLVINVEGSSFNIIINYILMSRTDIRSSIKDVDPRGYRCYSPEQSEIVSVT